MEMKTGKLFVVGTPIGNLGDMTYRAVETLKTVDFIAAEDTRVSIKLLNHFEISKPLVSYHEHNFVDSGDRIVSRLLRGESCAVITDAGMPAISDPGKELVKMCADNNIDVSVVPGPSAVTSAAALSGMDTKRFCFEGFVSINKSSRREHLSEIKDETRTMIFYEAPHKLRATLSDFVATFGEDREVAICRELTKIHEECVRTTLGEAKQFYSDLEPRGEFVLIVAGTKKVEEEPNPEEALTYARQLISSGMKVSDAARIASEKSGVSKNQIYKQLISSDK